jgi:hypothetical protein
MSSGFGNTRRRHTKPNRTSCGFGKPGGFPFLAPGKGSPKVARRDNDNAGIRTLIIGISPRGRVNVGGCPRSLMQIQNSGPDVNKLLHLRVRRTDVACRARLRWPKGAVSGVPPQTRSCPADNTLNTRSGACVERVISGA